LGVVSIAPGNILRLATWDDGAGPIDVELSVDDVDVFLKEMDSTHSIDGRIVTDRTISLIRGQIRSLQDFPELMAAPLKKFY